MSKNLAKPIPEAIFYQDKKLYAALATFPITKGHTVIVWKRPVKDLHLLSRSDFEYLMNIVDQIRNKLLKVLKVKKVYIIYMDEINQVHWHLVPRYNQKGYNMLTHKPKLLTDFSLVQSLKYVNRN